MFHASLATDALLIRPQALGLSDEESEAATDILRAFAASVGAKDARLSLVTDFAADIVLATIGAVPASTPDDAFILADHAHKPTDLRRLRSRDGALLVVNTPFGSDGDQLSFLAFSGSEFQVDTDRVIDLARALSASFCLQRVAIRRLAGYEAALERSEVGVIMLAPDGRLLFANRLAEQLLSAQEYLRRKGAGISAISFSDALKLQVAIEHVSDISGIESEDPIVVIARRYPCRPLLIHLSSAGQNDASGAAGAILRIIDPDRDLQASIEPVCGHYRLSPVETRLACALARGASLEAAAAALRIKSQTARSYLKQIFLKTTTNRQSELVRLLLMSTVRTRKHGRFRVV